MKKESRLLINLAELNDTELLNFRNELLIQRANLNSDYANELKLRTSEDFDPYSRHGERVFKKIFKKFEDRDIGLTYLEDLVAEEMRKRDKYKEEQMYIGGSKQTFAMSEKEFLEREEIKTKTYKARIDNGEYDE